MYCKHLWAKFRSRLSHTVIENIFCTDETNIIKTLSFTAIKQIQAIL